LISVSLSRLRKSGFNFTFEYPLLLSKGSSEASIEIV
jgi:hypothetical protein